MELLRPFFFGIIAASLALVFELVFSFTPNFDSELLFQKVSWILVLFVLIEELIKLAFVWKNFSTSKNNLTKLQIFFQSLLIGLGFALTEAALKTSGFLPEEFKNITSYFPFLGATIIHIGTAGLMGYFLTNAKRITLWTFLQILFLSFGWHFLFNFFEIHSFNFWLISIFLLILSLFIVLAGLKLAALQKTYTH
jgi:hypothetical protein